MTVRPVIELDINDAKFKNFLGLVEKYHETVKKMPGSWGTVEKKVQSVGITFSEMTAALFAQAELLRHHTDEHKKVEKTTEKTARNWRDMARSSKEVARNVAHTALSIAKWVAGAGIFTGLLGGGTLFGLDRLAHSAFGMRRESGGLGIGAAQMQAFGLNYGQYVDPQANLARIADAKRDMAQRWAFSAMGVSGVDSKDPAQLGTEMAERARRLWLQNPTAHGAQSNGLLQFYNMDELQRLGSATPEDLQRSRRGYGNDVASLGLDDGTLRKWQELSQQFDRAGKKIQAVFIDGLQGLAPNIGKLSDAFADAVGVFMRSPQLKTWMNDLGDGIGELAKTISSDSFHKTITGFVENLDSVVSALGAAARWIKSATPSSWWEKTKEVITSAPQAAPGLHWGDGPKLGLQSTPHNNPGALMRKGADGKYSMIDFRSPEVGITQMAKTLQTYQEKYGRDTLEKIMYTYAPPNENNTEQYITDLEKWTGLKRDQKLNTKDTDQLATIMAGIARKENVGQAGSKYSKEVIITVLNATGGSAVVTANQVK